MKKHFYLVATTILIGWLFSDSSHGQVDEQDYPRLLIHNFSGAQTPMPERQIRAIARRDLVVLGPIIMREDLASVRQIKELNPNICILLYTTAMAAANENKWMLGDHDESAIFAKHGESWSVQGPAAILSEQIPAEATDLAIKGSDLLDKIDNMLTEPDKFHMKPIVLIEDELIRVTAADGSRLSIVRGVGGSEAAAHSSGARVQRVNYPAWAGGPQNRFPKAEVLFLNMSDHAPFIEGRKPWQIKADYLLETFWSDPTWRELFDGFFFDAGRLRESTYLQLDADHDGEADAGARLALEEGLRKFSTYLREKGGDDLLFVFNNAEEIYPEANGRHREYFADGFTLDPESQRNVSGGQWALFMEPLRAWEELGTKPDLTMNTSQPGTADDYRQMRFALAASLLHGGYFQYRKHSGDWSNWRHWYDEYAVDQSGKPTDDPDGHGWLGRPISPAEPIRRLLKTPNFLKNPKWNAVSPGRPGGPEIVTEGQMLRITIPERGADFFDHLARTAIQVPGNAGDFFTLSLRVRADEQGLLGFRAGPSSPIHFYVSTEWQTLTFGYNFQGRSQKKMPLVFGLGQFEGLIEIDDLSWQRGAKTIGWKREFENGLALVNISPQRQEFVGLKGFRRISGRQDAAHNNGQPINGPLALQPWDAYLLVRGE